MQLIGFLYKGFLFLIFLYTGVFTDELSVYNAVSVSGRSAALRAGVSKRVFILTPTGCYEMLTTGRRALQYEPVYLLDTC